MAAFSTARYLLHNQEYKVLGTSDGFLYHSRMKDHISVPQKFLSSEFLKHLTNINTEKFNTL